MSDSPNIIIRAIWFVFVGWWLTGIVLGIAWFLNLTIIGLPAGIKLINKSPYILSLKRFTSGDKFSISKKQSSSPNLLVRFIYFIFIGWWASGILMLFAYILSLTIIGLPFAVKLFNYLPYIVSLKKY